ncbi:MAG: ComEC family competence protein, partial [Candidatus Nealsonbacteria bacterium]
MTASKIFLYFCLSFVGGIFLNSIITISQLLMLSFLIFGILLISLFWQYKKFVIIGFCILFLVAGIWRHQQAELKITNNELRRYNDLEQKITLIGQIIKEPDIREKNIKLTIKPEKIKGKVLVTTNRYPEYQYGDKLKITGNLKTPLEFEDFNYKDYLAKDGIYSVVYWPEIEILDRENYRSPTAIIYAKILSFKNKLRESIYQNLSPPQSSILGAMILGDKSRISQEWKERLNYAGVRHLTAVSGMHVAILTSVLMALLIGFGLWRQQAFYFAIILITLFIVMTGLQPSAIRAGIMGGLFLFAQYLGRLNSASRAVIMAAAVMLAQNPLLLRLDVGFQLSFLAMMGIIYLMPAFRSWFRKIPNLFQFRNILAMTLSAQIFTLPILIYNFGYMS